MFTKKFMGEGQFSWGKINPGKFPLGKLPLPSWKIAPHPAKKKKRKFTPEKNIS